jgi:hypothetical protein
VITADVMAEMAVALGTISGLRAYAFPVDRVQPPCAFVEPPRTIEFDAAMRGGADRMTMDVVVVVAHADARSGIVALSPYTDGAGVSSVRAAVDGHVWVAASAVRVVSCEVEPIRVADTAYWAATFEIDVIGGS